MRLTIRQNTLSTTQVAYLCTKVSLGTWDGDYISPANFLQRFCPGVGLDVTVVESTTNAMMIAFSRSTDFYSGAVFVADYQEVV